MSLAHRGLGKEHNPGSDPDQNKSPAPLPNGEARKKVCTASCETLRPCFPSGQKEEAFLNSPPLHHTVLHKLYVLKTNAVFLNAFKSSQIRSADLQVRLKLRAQSRQMASVPLTDGFASSSFYYLNSPLSLRFTLCQFPFSLFDQRCPKLYGTDGVRT